MKIAGYIEVIELDLNNENYCDGNKYPYPGLFWLPNAYGGSYALVHGDPPQYAVFTIAYPKDHLSLKDTITTKSPLKRNPFEPPIMPQPGSDPNFNPYDLGSYKTHEVISTDTFLKALALAMNQNTNNCVMEEILK